MTDGQPMPDTADLRQGVAVHDGLLALLPLIGVWRGSGTGVVASTGAAFSYGQQLSFVHDGRPFLAYEARSWLTDDGGTVLRQAWRETGFWRPGPGQDDVEVVLASNTGQAMQFVGVAGDQRWDVHSICVVPTPTAREVDGERRLYAILGEDLVYVSELAPAGQPYAPHLNARLSRLPTAASHPDRD
jgi:hypothetical protein